MSAAIQWTEKQTKEVMKKVIRRAEVSRIARLLQHRLALASVKTQHGWENLTLDAIEPKVDEDLKRKRRRTSQENTPSPQQPPMFSDGDLAWLRKNRRRTTNVEDRPSSQASDIGPLPTFNNPKKRPRAATTDFGTPASNKRQRSQQESQGRMIQSSPGYHDVGDISHGGQKFYPTFHSSPPRTPPRRRKFQPSFHSSPPKTPPRRMKEGADLLLYLATSPSPAAAAMPRTRYVPTTPPSRASALPSSMMSTPACPQTPQTGFNFADFVNITPSPAQAAFGPVGRGTPIAKAQRRLNFDQLVPPSGSPPNRPTGLGVALGGNLVS
ncbi:hypothetical protein BZA05DRAFT_391309 [Tricharina praecox]|uniref:uncharacterized protein n=1 Tax=Tricharina praecox TaxID=43433 RepID=UPI00221F2B09|nr:uncharacterized protein BZA05DRAFT_391309 [Tricharina praecox]KAI5855342.1 hypothetical protein BZA05DRAFT_391309 [Tricharina praecox]